MARKSKRRKQPLDIDENAARILRPLSAEEAFRFYIAVGEPTGEAAASLPDFLEKVKSAKLESLLFHLRRKDFQSWARRTLGDSKLAKRMERIPLLHDDSLKRELSAAVENRIKELADTSDICIHEDLAVPLRAASH